MTTVSDHAHTILEYIAAHPRSTETDILSALQETYDLTLSRHLLMYLSGSGLLSASSGCYKLTPKGTEALQQARDDAARRANEKAERKKDRIITIVLSIVSAVISSLLTLIIKQ